MSATGSGGGGGDYMMVDTCHLNVETGLHTHE